VLVLFWLPLALLVWVYVGYPVVAALAARVRPFRLNPSVAGPRIVTVGIAAHNEGHVLQARLVDVLQQEVPFELEVFVASDGSTDDTAAVVREMAAADPRIHLLDLPRSGQSEAQNGVFEESIGEIVVLTDADTRFDPGCLAALVAPFSDPRVGATTGRLAWFAAGDSATARDEGAYWRYEQLIRRWESRAGWLTAVTGAILAVRRSSYRPIPSHASMDQLLPLEAAARGLVVLEVADARATERPVANFHAQFRNRTRTATQGIRANLSMARRLMPWRRPAAALAIWSHKLLRWATPILLIAAAVGALGLTVSGNPSYSVVLAAGLVLVALAGLGWILGSRGPMPRWASFPFSVVVVNLAFLNAWLNVVRGRRIEAWHRTAWDARSGAVARRTPDGTKRDRSALRSDHNTTDPR
jgi:cellulose synthase/poly-beta-1,6-N-acetylglucosamine synthase-like glycosyltransferase